MEVYKQKKVVVREPREVMMSNGTMAMVPYVNTEPRGIIGK
jgi:hypothetical protein